LRVATVAATYFLVQFAGAGASAQEAAPDAPASQAAARDSASTTTEQAAGPDGQVGEVVVFGRGLAKIGIAQAASEGTVGGSDLLVRPLLRTAELLEAVPGLIAAQHSGSGKANQYFLRGFNLDHGSDFTTYVDGVQMNLRTHGHGQGYLDLNGLIPEIVEREDFQKGPYRADSGDFAMAGAARMTTIESYDRPWVSGEVGSYGWRRLAAGGTAQGGKLGQGYLTFVGEAKMYDGPWQEPEHLRHLAGFLKYSTPISLGTLDLTAHAYHAKWRPTEQIPERIIGSPGCPDVFCSPDPSADGETTRFVANAQLRGNGWHGNLYGQYYNWSMFSNPTYANPDGSSAQIQQFDRRWITGLTAEKIWEIGPRLELTLGTENRYDDIGRVGVYHTADRAFVESLGAYSVKEASAVAYGEATWRPIEGLRIIGGLRGDYYHYDVSALDSVAAGLGVGKGHDGIVSPKINAAYKFSDNFEVYADWGRGFHSNDVRGAVNVTDQVPVLVPGTGKEVGARFQAGTFTLTTTYWWLSLGSELKFVGDSNAVEPSGASKRHGYEIVAFWRPLPWLAIDANYTASHARYENGDYIPNAFENAASVGVSAVSDKWEGSVRLRHLGPYPLIEDNSIRDHGSTVVNVRGARKFAHVQVYAELLNVFNSRDKDITYYYESYIPSFDAAPTDGRLSRIVEPRTLRVGAKYSF
jgi:outer membrane receptor protein involved in Fe transport